LEESEDLKNDFLLQIKKTECRLKQAQVILNDEAAINLQLKNRAGSMEKSIEDITHRQNQIRHMERLASARSDRNSSATDSFAPITRPIEITKVKTSAPALTSRPKGLPKSPRNRPAKTNSILSKLCQVRSPKNQKKVVPPIDFNNLESDVKVINLVDSPLNYGKSPFSRNYMQ
jgi:hypothetical protein